MTTSAVGTVNGVDVNTSSTQDDTDQKIHRINTEQRHQELWKLHVPLPTETPEVGASKFSRLAEPLNCWDRCFDCFRTRTGAKDKHD